MKHTAAALLLSAVMLLPGAALPAHAAQSGSLGDLRWSLSGDGTLTVTGRGDMPSDEDYPLNDLRDSIRRVVIGEGVTSVGDSAFIWCDHLTEVQLPGTLKRMEWWAFADCRELRAMDMPDSVTELEPGVLYGDWSLQRVRFSAGLKELPSVDVNEEVLYGTCVGCKALETVILPEGLEVIGVRSFGDCEKLTSVTVPATVQRMDMDCFCDCTSLARITILNPDCVIGGGYGAEWVEPGGLSTKWVEPGNLSTLGATISNSSSYNLTEDTYTGVIVGWEGSTAQEYAKACGYRFEALHASLGDLDGNGRAIANDAAAVLAARIGAKRPSGLAPAQVSAADVSGDGAVNANDAAMLLRYAAYVGAKGTDSIEVYFGRSST